jgi:hypothetical protein
MRDGPPFAAVHWDRYCRINDVRFPLPLLACSFVEDPTVVGRRLPLPGGALRMKADWFVGS